MIARSVTPSASEPIELAGTTFTLEEVAQRLDVSEPTIREWLASFRWERRYDGAGHLQLTERDLEFLRLIKSLKDVDRTCESIVRLIAEEPGLTDEPLDIERELEAEEAASPPEQDPIETLKAELKELHAKPRRPFWKFWSR